MKKQTPPPGGNQKPGGGAQRPGVQNKKIPGDRHQDQAGAISGDEPEED